MDIYGEWVLRGKLRVEGAGVILSIPNPPHHSTLIYDLTSEEFDY